MRSNPYFIEEPAIISFSGGATSGFMLWNILQAHGGRLPPHVKVVFANTGLEHEETLKFIERCSLEWNVEIYWLEYKKKAYQEVNYASASRNGEPFDRLIEDKKYLPNPIARICTIELKIKTIENWASSLPFFKNNEYIELIGLRYDEPKRVMRLKESKTKIEKVCPLYHAKHCLNDVDLFWNKHHFNLAIPRLYGNCVGCFLKGTSKLNFIAQENPKLLEWWAQREEKGISDIRKLFRSDRPSYRKILNMAKDQMTINYPDDETIPCNCTD